METKITLNDVKKAVQHLLSWEEDDHHDVEFGKIERLRSGRLNVPVRSSIHRHNEGGPYRTFIITIREAKKS
jgi:hypothetical protein